MQLLCRQSRLAGPVEIPGSKSHTIRAVAAASLAEGNSVIREPLISSDTLSAVEAYRALGAHIDVGNGSWHVDGFGGWPHAPKNVIDVGNSGTTLRICVGSASLLDEGSVIFTGDKQIRKRPIGPLIKALNNLGANVVSAQGNGCAPLVVKGRLRGGHTSIEAVTSQYLSSLLMCCPLAEGDSVIDVTVLNEVPYVDMTLEWLKRCGIKVDYEDDYKQFRLRGGQKYKTIDIRVPADFSSATFFLCAGALGDNDVTVRGLDMDDAQGDKAVVEYLKRMGAKIEMVGDSIHVTGSELTGCEFDLNATPDALPMLAVVGCFAKGQTRLVNVPQARLKETDRIAVMCDELTKMGGKIRELKDGLVIEQSELKGTDVNGHNDHRVVMALAVAGTMIEGETWVDTAQALEVTYPGFVESMCGLGEEMEISE